MPNTKQPLIREFLGKPSKKQKPRLTTANMNRYIEEFNKAGKILAPVVNELRETAGSDEFKKLVTTVYDDMMDVHLYIDEYLKIKAK